MKHKIPQKKLETVQVFVNLVKSNPIVGIVNMENLPAKQLQNMKEQLRGTVDIIMTKRRLIKIILDNCKDDKKGIEKLASYLDGMPAMIFTKDNPFILQKKLDKNKSSAPAKGGQTANQDIVVPAGPTPFAPGPIIGELGALRIKAGIEDNKVTIKEDSVVVRKGEVISGKVAGILLRLGIEPMEIGLDLVAVYENGEIFTKDVLAIDEKEYMNNLGSAAHEGFCLAIKIGYATRETIEPMLHKAYSDAKSICLSQKIPADELMGDILSIAEHEMLGLKSKLDISEKTEAKAENSSADDSHKED